MNRCAGSPTDHGTADPAWNIQGEARVVDEEVYTVELLHRLARAAALTGSWGSAKVAA